MSRLIVKILILLCLCAFITPNLSFAGAFFSDGFESGDASHVDANSGAKWDGHVGLCSGPKDYGTCVSTKIVHSGKHSLRFSFRGNPDLSKDAWAEQRFTLGTPNNEIFMRYYIYFPSNYVIRDAIGATNTKFFRLWGDNYNSPIKVGLSINHTMQVGFKARITGWPRELSCSGSIGFIPKQIQTRWKLSKEYLGKWICFEFHIKKDAGSGDGMLQMYVNGKLKIDLENLSWAGAPCSPGYFLNGYLMGWSNSGFNQDTSVYIDDVVFSTTPIGLLDAKNQGKPAPPQGFTRIEK